MKTPNKTGRGNKALIPDEATLKLVRGAGQIHATVVETALLMGVAVSTFELFLNIPEVRLAWDAGRADGKMSLRRDQFALAKKNAQMSIHLGKVYLGQEDRQHLSIDATVILGGAAETLSAKLARALAKRPAPGTDGDDRGGGAV